MKAIYETTIEGVRLLARGKVRDIYELGDRLLIVATDRLSAFDVVFPTPIPWKGIVLTQLSLFWFEKTRSIIRNHILTTDFDEYPKNLAPYRNMLAGRSMIVKKAKPLPVECVVRGYLDGSAWRDYQRTGDVCGVVLPAGFRQRDKLPEPIFTPATKATTGHDENISFQEAQKIVDPDVMKQARDVSIAIYRYGHEYLQERRLVLSDTKFEFGLDEEGLLLIDECMTPDSSRFWLEGGYFPGGNAVSLDKQYVRDYVERIGWDKTPPAPELPPEVINQTTERYLTAFEKITGEDLRGTIKIS